MSAHSAGRVPTFMHTALLQSQQPPPPLPPLSNSPLCELRVVGALAAGRAGLHRHVHRSLLAISAGAVEGDAELGGAAVVGGADGAHVCKGARGRLALGGRHSKRLDEAQASPVRLKTCTICPHTTQ